MNFLKIYTKAFLIFLITDFIWLGFVANNFYKKQLGFLLRDEFLIAPAIIFYLLFIFGLVIFVINPSIQKQSMKQALFLGALFGLITYSTYDLTNYSTIKNWPPLVVIVDLMWGIFIAGSVSVLTVFFCRKKEN